MSLSTGEITAIVIGVGNFTAWAKLFTDARKNNGNGKACPLHAVLAQEIVTLHGENRTDHQKIFDDIKGLSVAVAGAASAAASAAAVAAAATARRPRTNDRA